MQDRISRPTPGESDVIPSTSASAADERCAFEEIIDRLNGHTDRVSLATSKLATIGNRIMGTLPEQGEGEDGKRDPSVRIEPDGLLDQTLLTLNRLDSSFARLENAALRLERL